LNLKHFGKNKSFLKGLRKQHLYKM